METQRLTETCRLVLEQGDITKTRVDAIVNAANEWMLGGGGVDGAIHDAAGRDLYLACLAVPEVRPGVRCPTGEARLTPGFDLPARFVIHTVGPIYDRDPSPERSLASAYRSSLELARQHRLSSIAFPAISCGVYGYPHDEAARIALETCRAHAGELSEIRFVLFLPHVFFAWKKASASLPRLD